MTRALAPGLDGGPAGLDDDELMFLDVVEQVAADEVAPRAAAIDAAGAVPDELRELLLELRLHEVGVAESAGGEGGRPLVGLLAVQTLARASAAVALGVGAGQAAAHARAGGGGAMGIADDLPPAARADAGGAMGIADDLHLAAHADASGAAAAADDAYDWTPAPVRRTGLRGAPGIALDAPDDGPGRAHWLLVVGAVAAGVGQGAVASARDYLCERRQFGRPLAEFGALRRMLAEMSAGAASAAALVHACAAQPAPGSAAAAQAARAAARAACAAADDALQLHGGYGYTREYPVERLLRDAVSLRALAGGRDGEPVASALLGAPAPAPKALA